MHKNCVPGVALMTYSSMEEPLSTSKDSIACYVITPIHGRCLITALYDFSTGSGSGSRKAVPLEGSVSFPATVGVNLMLSRTTGLIRFPKSNQITRLSVIWSMTLPTSIRTAV